MPYYIYFNTETEEYKEVFQTMKEPHVYSGENGLENCWRRVFTVPQASIDAHIDPFSQKQFSEKTGTKKGTFGDLLDKSSELSEKRAALSGGIDPVKEKYYENYSKKRKGAKHFDQLKTFENNVVKVDFTKD